ncbi:Asparagine synthetase domain-containing protein 1 [Chytridiales sp. JEL 0842]|nr:Asparagine synthetase domain-containing protein 1 [Chytridiales sp. JEL 0842]
MLRPEGARGQEAQEAAAGDDNGAFRRIPNHDGQGEIVGASNRSPNAANGVNSLPPSMQPNTIPRAIVEPQLGFVTTASTTTNVADRLSTKQPPLSITTQVSKDGGQGNKNYIVGEGVDYARNLNWQLRSQVTKTQSSESLGTSSNGTGQQLEKDSPSVSESDEEMADFEEDVDCGFWDDAWDDEWNEEEEDEEDVEASKGAEDTKAIFSGVEEISERQRLSLSLPSNVGTKASPTSPGFPKPRKWMLPVEVVFEIHRHLDPKEYLAFMCVCRQTMHALASAIYRTPLLQKQATLDAFLRTMKQAKLFLTMPYFNLVEHLDLASLKISDDDLFDLVSIVPNLKSLSLRNRFITSTPLAQLATMTPKLTELNIAGCSQVETCILVNKLVGLASPSSAHFPTSPVAPTPALLKSLTLSRTRITNEDILQLVLHFQDLSYLRLTDCKGITNLALRHLGRFAGKLAHLGVSECGISNSGISYLCCKDSVARKSLQYLEMNKTAIDCNKVVRLIIETCPNISEIAAKSSEMTLRRLRLSEEVDLPLWNSLSPDAGDVEPNFEYEKLPDSDMALKLEVIKIDQVRDSAFPKAITNAYRLTTFHATNNELSPSFLTLLAQFGSLKTLDLSSSDGIRASTDYLNLTHGPLRNSLETLILRHCRHVNVHVLMNLAKRCPMLNTIDVRSCSSSVERVEGVDNVETGVFTGGEVRSLAELDEEGPDSQNTCPFTVPLHDQHPQFQNGKDGKEDPCNLYCALHGSVLHLRGPQTTVQPIKAPDGSLMGFNGEIYDSETFHVSTTDSDSSQLFSTLFPTSQQSPSGSFRSHLLRTLSRLHGPWAIFIYHAPTRRVYFGRDFLGRRSMVVHWPRKVGDVWWVSSVGVSVASDGEAIAGTRDAHLIEFKDGSEREGEDVAGDEEDESEKGGYWRELDADGLYEVSLDHVDFASGEAFEQCVKKYTWNPYEMRLEEPSKDEDKLLIAPLQTALNLSIPNGLPPISSIPKINQTLPLHLRTPPPDVGLQLEGCTAEMSDALKQFERVLEQAVRLRVENLHLSSPQAKPRLAILFSGGLDCMVLAGLAARCLEPNVGIDLLNVGFENPRIQKASGRAKKAKSGKTKGKKEDVDVNLDAHPGWNNNVGISDAQAERETVVKKDTEPTKLGLSQSSPTIETDDTYNVPDRLTGLQGFRELSELYPNIEWRFVEINVPYAEAVECREKVKELMAPLESVMDLSIAVAFWFAARGKGMVHASNPLDPLYKESRQIYNTPAKVLLSGLGADEQLGGYNRHRSRFVAGSYPELLSELQLDVSRISKRNLGRDDRIVGDHGREIRFPYLDENVVTFLSGLRVDLKMDLRYERGIGEKRLLRMLSAEIGLKRAGGEWKRAVQFGARSARMENTKEKGMDKLS